MDMNKLNTFKLRMNKCDFKKADKLKAGLYELEIITTPKIYYLKWYWRILNFLTFRRFFNATFTYTVKLIEMKNLNELSNHMLLEHFTDAVADKNYNPSSEDYNQSGFTYDELKNEILTRMSKTKQDE